MLLQMWEIKLESKSEWRLWEPSVELSAVIILDIQILMLNVLILLFSTLSDTFTLLQTFKSQFSRYGTWTQFHLKKKISFFFFCLQNTGLVVSVSGGIRFIKSAYTESWQGW